jgi:transposase
MGTTANRPKYKRDNRRYPSDLTGEEWARIEALIPPAKHGGRERKVGRREVVNGRSKRCKQRLRRGMDVLSTGCQWRQVSKDLLPKSTRYDNFDLWTYDGTSEDTPHALYVKCREQIGREVSPTAAIIDSDPSTSLSNHWFEVISAGFLVVQSGCLVSTVFAKMRSFLAQAIRASLWGLPAIFRRAYNTTKAGFHCKAAGKVAP